MAAVTDSALSTAGQLYNSYLKTIVYILTKVSAGNSYLTFYNTAALGPKGIAKRHRGHSPGHASSRDSSRLELQVVGARFADKAVDVALGEATA